MSEETKKVLEMLAEGKINADQAEKLLEKLAASPSSQAPPAENAGKSSEAGKERPRFLRIVVEKPGQDQVNIRMPLSFACTGSRMLAVLPPRVSEKLAELGIDLSAVAAAKDKNWAEAIENTDIHIDKGDKKVRIFCE
jgi:hypothetical protein